MSGETPLNVGPNGDELSGQAWPRLRQAAPAGLMDAGFASLATFVVGIVAVNRLSPAVLGVYALFFSGFVLTSIVPAHMIFMPFEVEAIRYQLSHRRRLVYRSLRVGGGIVGLAAVASVAIVGLVPPGAPRQAVIPLTITTVACVALSPAQDHVRRMLHLSGCSWRAVVASAVQLLGVGAAVLVLVFLHVPDPWIPLGALAIANAASLITSLVLSAGPIGAGLSESPELRLGALIRAGRWLLLAGIAPGVAGLVTAALIAHLASTVELGYAEAARVVAQPVLVLGTGLIAVFGPRVMESAAGRDAGAARRLTRLYIVMMIMGGVVYAFLAGGPWRWNILIAVVPAAYVVPNLAILYIAGNLLAGASSSLRSELLGAKRNRAIAVTESASSIAQCLAATTAALVGAFARPLSVIALGIVRSIGLCVSRERLYQGRPR